jgi:hypothetical protein
MKLIDEHTMREVIVGDVRELKYVGGLFPCIVTGIRQSGLVQMIDKRGIPLMVAPKEIGCVLDEEYSPVIHYNGA